MGAVHDRAPQLSGFPVAVVGSGVANPRKIASGRPIREKGMAVSVILSVSVSVRRLPCIRVASKILNYKVRGIRCRTGPRSTKNNRKPEGRSRTMMPKTEVNP
jgi:hypothetical protein